jgi:catechol 2,3-dioxygenase-like lactoylglutathione lyase family enzyme
MRLADSGAQELVMSDPNVIILYVKSPPQSAAFYADLLGKPAVEASPGFAMFALSSGVMLGLWAAQDVQPAATAAGGCEVAFAVADPAAVDAMHAAWRGKGLRLIQAPTAMDFGYTFAAVDPDGHRLRVFAPAAS